MTFLTKARTLMAATAMALTAATGAFADKVEVLDTAPEDAVVVNIDQLKYETPEITIKAGDALIQP